MDPKKTLEYINQVWDESCVPTLTEFVKIPNVSPEYDPEWATNGLQEKAMKLLIDWVESQKIDGLTYELLEEKGRTPLLFLSVEAAKDNKADQTVLMYGHMDKQPPLTEFWNESLHPYKPVIVDGKLYGRGAADDGYAIFAALTSIQNLKKQGLSHTKIVILIEASEESASPDLPFYVNKLTKEGKLGDVELIVCLDSGAGNYDQFWLTTSLRGITPGVLTVQVLEEAVHSGAASGVVPSSFRILRRLLDRIEDSDTGKVLVPECFTEISEKRIQQAQEAANYLGDEIWKEFPLVSGGTPMGKDCTELLLNKTWRPVISYTGASGFPPVEIAGNVLRTHSSIKLSIRIPPGVEANEAGEAIKKILEKDPPYGAKVTYHVEDGAAGWASPELADWLEKSIQEASNQYFNGPAAMVGEGGSIPFMGMLGKQFPKAQFVITGVLGPGSNAHGPNEFFHIDAGKKVTSCVSNVLYDFCVQKNK